MAKRIKSVAALAVLALVVAGCSSKSSSSTQPNAAGNSGASSSSAPAATGSDNSAPAAVSGTGPTIAAVGDLVCAFGTAVPPIQKINHHKPSCDPRSVSRLIQNGHYKAFLPLGDLQYSYGGYWRYKKYWDRYYGKVVNITRPVAGNHEGYADFTGYVKYFGPNRTHMPAHIGQVKIGQNVGRVTGYYSYNIGSWHLIALNSQLCMEKSWNLRTGWTNPIHGGGCKPDDPQMQWLAKDLAAHTNECTLAYFHHPLYDVTGKEWGSGEKQMPMYQLLYDKGVDVILTGHDHTYQRWGPMNPQGEMDPKGFQQFIVGTGGDSYGPLDDQSKWSQTVQAAQSGSFGALELQLNSGGYNYKFVTSPGEKPYTDEGSGTCH